jgi:serpin B
MRKLFTFSLMVIMIFIAGCSAFNPTIEPTEPNEQEQPTKDMEETKMPSGESGFVKSDLARETSPQVDPDSINLLSQGNTAFALSFYDQIREGTDNIIFSPFSISLALSMTLAGAETTTEQAMLEALRLSLPESEVHPAFNALLLAIEESQEMEIQESEGSQFQLNIANSIWGQMGYDFKQAFLDTLAKNYGAGINNVDFVQNPEGARVAINDWVEEETQDKIQDLIPQGAIDSLTRLVLANAIYFKGSWLYPFSESRTANAPFTTLEGSEISVEMMKVYGERFLYGEGENYKVISLPYLSRDFSMVVLVPESGSFSDFEGSLTPEILNELLKNIGIEDVNLEMPKFDFETTTNAKDPLSVLGMSQAFKSETADFSGITEAEEVYITDVLHKATITVDEEGTEAAAATAVIVGIESAMPGEPRTLIIDRPFMFFIRHQPTGTILFMGRVTQP